MRLAPTAAIEPRRRFLIIQIDGLSRGILDRALAGDSMRNTRRLLVTGQLERRELSVGLPSSTPAFQASIMYGVRPDIPGFHYYDKREGLELHFPERGVADLVERRLSDGRAGILEDGACYGCVFTGGAPESLWTFARLKRLTRAGSGLRRTALSLLLIGWVALKCVGLTLVTLARSVGRTAAALPAGRVPLRRAIEALAIDIGVSIWARQLFTLLVSADLYRGVPAIYVNFLDYDVFSHAFGPADRLAFRALRRVDRSIQQLARVIRRLPELGYDLYILSDHGQAPTRPFHRVTRGVPIDRVVRDALGVEGDEVKVIAAGPNAFVYFMDRREALSAAEIESRHPGVLARLSRHAGIGLVLARGAGGPLCWHRGHRVPLGHRPDPAVRDPFARRAGSRAGRGGAARSGGDAERGRHRALRHGRPRRRRELHRRARRPRGPVRGGAAHLHPPSAVGAASRGAAHASGRSLSPLPRLPRRGGGGAGRDEEPGMRGPLTPARHRGPILSLRAYLVGLILVCAVPAVAFSVWLTIAVMRTAGHPVDAVARRDRRRGPPGRAGAGRGRGPGHHPVPDAAGGDGGRARA